IHLRLGDSMARHEDEGCEEAQSEHNRPKAFHPILPVLQVREKRISVCKHSYGREGKKFQGRTKRRSQKCGAHLSRPNSRNFLGRAIARQCGRIARYARPLLGQPRENQASQTRLRRCAGQAKRSWSAASLTMREACASRAAVSKVARAPYSSASESAAASACS